MRMNRADHLGPWPRITNTAPQDERTANLESTESFNKCHLAEAFTCYLIDVDKRKTVETSVNLVVSKWIFHEGDQAARAPPNGHRPLSIISHFTVPLSSSPTLMSSYWLPRLSCFPSSFFSSSCPILFLPAHILAVAPLDCSHWYVGALCRPQQRTSWLAASGSDCGHYF